MIKFENIQIGYDSISNAPIFEKRMIKARVTAPTVHQSRHAVRPSYVNYLTSIED